MEYHAGDTKNKVDGREGDAPREESLRYIK